MKRTPAPLPPEQTSADRLAQTLRRARHDRRLTMEDMANRAGVTRKTYSALEKGSTRVSIGVLLRVLTVLGYPERLGQMLESDPIGDALAEAHGPKRIRERGDVADF